jgi:hypothetical protein
MMSKRHYIDGLALRTRKTPGLGATGGYRSVAVSGMSLRILVFPELRLPITQAARGAKTRHAVGYEGFIGAKKHLVLGSLSYIGPPQGRNSFAKG